MKDLGLKCQVRIKRYRSYKGEIGKVAPNLIDRNFHADAPNQKWTTDITEFSLFGKKLYLSPILDMYNGEIISYNISERPHLGQVMDMLEKYEVTTLTWAVSALVLLNRLHEFMYKVPPKINKILFSGEEMPSKHLKDWMQQYPDAEFVNLYGPTEITCNCSYYRIDKNDVPEKLPIGNVYPGKVIYLVDENGSIISESETETVGEICVAGNELALGYYNNEEATAKAFVELKDLGRVYKTGDLGFRRDGLLHFAGRRDFQIKHNGHRIELEEVERALNSLPEIGQACCIYDANKYRIIAYYTGDASGSGVPDKKSIVAGLKEKLPEYMLPNIYKYMEELPLSKNGKIDRNKLREMK